MKPLARSLSLIALCLVAACSGGDSDAITTGGGGPPASNITGFGTLTLSGTDTASLGTSMTVGDVAVTFDANGDLLSVLFLDELSVITSGDTFIFPDGPSPLDFTFGDPNHFFVMSIIDDEATGARAISLGFGGMFSPTTLPFNYGCNTPPAGFINCESAGTLVVDKPGQTITFVDVTVSPSLSTSATAVLTLNGTLRWL